MSVSQDLVLAVWTVLTVGTATAQVGMRSHDREVLAGGPLEIELVVENTGSHPFSLVVGGDSATGRPAFVTFMAVVENTAVVLDDPAVGSVYIGGPVSTISVAPGVPFVQTMLVNDFVRLEKVLGILTNGQRAGLQVTCRWTMKIGESAQEAVEPGAPMAEVVLTLHLGVRRDDAMLAALIDRLAQALYAEWNVYAASRQAKPLAQLTSLRLPSVLPHLQKLMVHPDQAVRGTVQRALRWIKA